MCLVLVCTHRILAHSKIFTHTGAQNVRYSLQEKENVTENFVISSLTGVIQIVNAPDYEKTQFYRFNVEASDNEGLTSMAVVVVHVEDRNDNAPVFLETSARVSIVESVSNSYILHTVEAVDADFANNRQDNPNSFVKYKIVGGNIGEVFSIDPYKGSSINSLFPKERKERNHFFSIS